MRMKSVNHKHQLNSEYGHPDAPATNMSERSLDALWKRLDVAESTVRTLERENEQLRAERTRAVLAAARATKESNDQHGSVANESGLNFETLTKELKLAEAARAEAARERQAAIEAVREALKEEYSRKIAIIQEKHADELAALSAMAAKQARSTVAKELDSLASDVSDAKRALIIARQKHEEDLRILEENLGKRYGEQIEALHRHYATALETLSRQKKEQFATELMSSLSSAHAAWQEDTAKQLQRAAKAAANAVDVERTRWQRRHKLTLRRAARRWRRRERRRMLAARAQWNSARRRAVEACNVRWQSKFDRIRKQTHLIASCSRAFASMWQHIKSRAIPIASSQTAAHDGTACQNATMQPTRLQAALMSAVLIFLGINFSLTAGLPTASHGRATDEKAPSVGQIASVPAGKSDAGKNVVSPKPGTDRAASPPEEETGNAARTKRSVTRHPARQTVVLPDQRVTEQIIRERLQENIRNLRMGRTTD